MSVFSKAQGVSIPRSFFKLDYEKKFDCDAGQIIPFMSKLMVPGDLFKIGNEIVVRTQPQVAPTLHEINIYTYYFFCPLRLLFGSSTETKENGEVIERLYEINEKDFETFITGGVKGDGILKGQQIELPRWIPTGNALVNDNWNGIPSGTTGSNADWDNVTTTDNGVYSLWDYFGFPVDVIPNGAFPTSFLKRMYNFIWNEFFRDENLQLEVDIDSDKVLNCAWKKDYFTSALPWQQRGDSPALPFNITGSIPVSITGSSDVDFSFGDILLSPSVTSQTSSAVIDGLSGVHQFIKYTSDSTGTYSKPAYFDGSETPAGNPYTGFTDDDTITKSGSAGSGKYNHVQARPLLGSVNGSGFSGSGDTSSIVGTSFNISDLRLAVQIQKWLERNATGGYRMREFLLSHFGVAPNDERLQRPQFLGGSKSPLIISEVLQTSASESGPTGSKQGNLAGHGISADQNFICNYHALEFGVVMGLMCIKPKATYQQGISKEWLQRTKFDFFFNEFSHLSEQAVEIAEIFATDNGNLDENDEPVIFGFQGRYNELRTSHSEVCGGLRDKFDYWHLGRKFNSAPSLNGDFIKMNPSKRIFAVESEPGFIVDVGNIIRGYRPLPVYPTPGLIDHF